MSALLLSAAACGQKTVPAGPAPVPTTPPAAGSTSPPAVSSTPPSTQPGPPQTRPTQGTAPGDGAPAQGQVDASALPPGYPHDVTLAEGGKVVVIHAEEGGCDHLSAAAGEQTAQHAVVKITVTHAPRGQMCPMHVTEISLPVTLAQPLGGRTLVLQPGP
ncbi:MAG TPA: hypothetical protein VG674_20795 [Amycolatopsis sp.]|nr:hypothetical protein [Amycolatopsis sp.]